MLRQHFSPNGNQVVRLFQAGGTAHTGRADNREGGRLSPASPPSRDLVDCTFHQGASIAEADREASSPWRTALTPFLKGLAICGVSLHPTAVFHVQAVQTSEKIHQHRESHERGRSEGTESSDAFELERVEWAACSSRHWSWLSSLASDLALRDSDARHARAARWGTGTRSRHSSRSGEARRRHWASPSTR
jgi:hypothetical protein